ncbi:hypothetical protein PENTCL1PPCAC_23383, partial [Pristionchus entomophagus]
MSSDSSFDYVGIGYAENRSSDDYYERQGVGRKRDFYSFGLGNATLKLPHKDNAADRFIIRVHKERETPRPTSLSLTYTTSGGNESQ